MENQDSRVLRIEVYAGETCMGGSFRMQVVDDLPRFVKACTRFIMVEMRRRNLQPDRMRTWIEDVASK